MSKQKCKQSLDLKCNKSSNGLYIVDIDFIRKEEKRKETQKKIWKASIKHECMTKREKAKSWFGGFSSSIGNSSWGSNQKHIIINK